jgi:hypothetical protein
MRRVVVVRWSLDAADDVRGGKWKRASEWRVTPQVGGGRGRALAGPSLPNPITGATRTGEPVA